MGRERILPRALGRTHPRWKSTYVAGGTQTAFVLVLVSIFIIADRDPFLELYGWMAIIATLCVLVIQALCCFAVINYFRKQAREDMHWWRTLLAPFLAAAAQAYVIYLLITNLEFLGGGSPFFVDFIPWMVLIFFAVGIGLAYYLKAKRPEKYERLGRITLEGA
jgi:amino acid transporter